MKSMTVRAALAALGLVFASSAMAQTINFTLFSSAYTGSGFQSIARDQSTGKFYGRVSYSGGSGVQVYNTEAAFAANSPATTITLGGSGGFYGTYDAVVNGKLYARTDNTTTATGRWDAVSGAQDATRASLANMGGANGTDTFDWGGYSGVNFFSDASGLYVFGHNPSGNWTLDRMSADLQTIQTTQSVTASVIGYAFDINHRLFLGASYSNPTVVSSFDMVTGNQQAVNFTLAGMGSVYLSSMYYDSGSDSLFAYNTQGGNIYVARNAASQFGAVPEPASLAILGMGALALIRRRRSR